MRWRVLLLQICWISWGGVLALEQPSSALFTPLSAVVEQQLEADNARLGMFQERLRALQQAQHLYLPHNVLNQSLVSRIEKAMILQEFEANNLELQLKASQREVEFIQSDIHSLQRRRQDIGRHLSIFPEIEVSIQNQNCLLETQHKRVRTLQATREVLYKTIALTKEWHKQLKAKDHMNVQAQQEKALHTLLDELRMTQQDRITQLDQFSHSTAAHQGVASVQQLTDLCTTLKTVCAEEKSNVLHTQLSIRMLESELQAVRETLNQEPPLMVLNTLQKPLENILNHLSLLNEVIEKKIEFLKNTQNFLQVEKLGSEEKQQLNYELTHSIQAYKNQCSRLLALTDRAQSAQKFFAYQLHRYLSSRQDFPGFNRPAWLNIWHKLQEIPHLLAVRFLALGQLILFRIKQASWLQSSAVGMLVLIGAWLWVAIKRSLRATRLRLIDDDEAREKKPDLLLFSFKLLDRYINILLLGLVIGGSWVFWGIPINSITWLYSLTATSLIFSVLIQTTRGWWKSNAGPKSSYADAIFYYRLRIMLGAGRLITLFSLLVHQLILDYEVRNLVARLFMLFLFLVALALFRIWALVPRLLERYWAKKPRYLKQVIRWLSFLLPMALVLNAILGLIGYVQLAWAIVGYQSVLLLAVCIYPVISGLLNEGFHWLSERSIRHFRNGWLWSEALLKPIYQVLKLVTFVALILVLFSFAGWREELRLWSTYPKMWFDKPLFTLFEVSVDTWKIMQVFLMSLFVVWLSRWTREFAYRWIFANLKDLGLRNSLSVFMQYMAVFVATLTTLQIIGLTLSVLKYILSGFAIGLSFGLRDLLNNFVTGVLLLIERPLKVGDWVTIGEYNGQVIYIGARSITINTENRHELVVPNADLFYKHFINWTRHDSIVRVSLPLLVSRKDDPQRIQTLVFEVVQTIPKILTHPAPGVYFQSTDQALLSFRVDYYVDLTQITSRSELNSEFLFALWKRFTSEGVHKPVVVHELRLSGQLDVDTFKNTSFEAQDG